jgi:hypothetical protein
LTDPSGPPLAAGAVVGEDDHQGVVALPGLLQVVQQSPDLVVGMRQEPGVDLRHPAEQAPLIRRHGVPRLGVVHGGEGQAAGAGAVAGRADGVDRGKLGVGRDDPHLLLAGQRLLPHRVVPHVELPGIPLDPVPGGVVRRVGRARCVIEEERLVRRDRLRVPDELQRLVGEVLGQVVALLGRPRLVHGVVVVGQVRVPLVGLGAEEPVEPLEPAAGRPVPPGRGEVHLVGGAQVPLAALEGLAHGAHLSLGRSGWVRRIPRRGSNRVAQGRASLPPGER